MGEMGRVLGIAIPVRLDVTRNVEFLVGDVMRCDGRGSWPIYVDFLVVWLFGG